MNLSVPLQFLKYNMFSFLQELFLISCVLCVAMC